MTTTQERFDAATNDIREAGVVCTTNVMTCCRGCTTPADIGIPDNTTPAVWTFGGQGYEFEWRNGEAVINELECMCDDMGVVDDEDDEDFSAQWDMCDVCRGERTAQFRPVKDLYFNHVGKDLTAATTAAAAFRAHGFEVDWDGTEDTAVRVIMAR